LVIGPTLQAPTPNPQPPIPNPHESISNLVSILLNKFNFQKKNKQNN